jgi:hypothetical protein
MISSPSSQTEFMAHIHGVLYKQKPAPAAIAHSAPPSETADADTFISQSSTNSHPTPINNNAALPLSVTQEAFSFASPPLPTAATPTHSSIGYSTHFLPPSYVEATSAAPVNYEAVNNFLSSYNPAIPTYSGQHSAISFPPPPYTAAAPATPINYEAFNSFLPPYSPTIPAYSGQHSAVSFPPSPYTSTGSMGYYGNNHLMSQFAPEIPPLTYSSEVAQYSPFASSEFSTSPLPVKQPQKRPRVNIPAQKRIRSRAYRWGAVPMQFTNSYVAKPAQKIGYGLVGIPGFLVGGGIGIGANALGAVGGLGAVTVGNLFDAVGKAGQVLKK